MKINYNEINAATGAGLFRPAAVLHYMRGVIDYLYTHNKNYTNTQYYLIENLKAIIDNMEEA